MPSPVIPRTPRPIDPPAFLAAHDHPCPACQYNLRGTAGEICPECGCTPIFSDRHGAPPIGWRIGLVFLVTTYALLLALAVAAVLAGTWLIAILAALSVSSGPTAFKRWRRTRRAFARLPQHIRQQLIMKWFLAAGLASFLLIVVLR